MASTKQFWKEWLDQSEDLLRRGRDVKLRTLPPGISSSVATPAGGTSPAPDVSSIPPEILQKILKVAKPVNNQKEYEEAHPNTWMIFKGQTVIRKP